MPIGHSLYLLVASISQSLKKILVPPIIPLNNANYADTLVHPSQEINTKYLMTVPQKELIKINFLYNL